MHLEQFPFTAQRDRAIRLDVAKVHDRADSVHVSIFHGRMWLFQLEVQLPSPLLMVRYTRTARSVECTWLESDAWSYCGVHVDLGGCRAIPARLRATRTWCCAPFSLVVCHA